MAFETDAEKIEILRDAKRRGLNMRQYASLPEVKGVVSEATLYRWKRRLGHLVDYVDDKERATGTDTPTADVDPTEQQEPTAASTVPAGVSLVPDQIRREPETIRVAGAGYDPLTVFINESRENHIPEALHVKDPEPETPEASPGKDNPDGGDWWIQTALRIGGLLVAAGGIVWAALGINRSVAHRKASPSVSHVDVGRVSTSGTGSTIPDFRQPF